ncbi:MAG: hypothetical protein KIS78_21245 [Labilithrix sp.]|nr:hypothetical protein [Labilithrix sp.]
MRTLGLLVLLLGCNSSEARPERARSPAPSASLEAAVPAGDQAPAPASPRGAVAPPAPDRGRAAPLRHRRLSLGADGPRAGRSPDGRFRPPPPGFAAGERGPGSAEFLRTPCRSRRDIAGRRLRGERLYDAGRHPNIVAVADIDVGKKDLQHRADAIIRLHAGWRYGRGERRHLTAPPRVPRVVAGDRRSSTEM